MAWEENPYGAEPIDVTAGSVHTGSNGWTVEGGTAFYVRNEGDAPIYIEGFLYEIR